MCWRTRTRIGRILRAGDGRGPGSRALGRGRSCCRGGLLERGRRHHLREGRCGHWLGDDEALNEVTPEGLEAFELFVGLDTFRNDLEVESMRELDGGRDDCGACIRA